MRVRTVELTAPVMPLGAITATSISIAPLTANEYFDTSVGSSPFCNNVKIPSGASTAANVAPLTEAIPARYVIASSAKDRNTWKLVTDSVRFL